MMGDLPDFDSMSEEEQMRWLESLAKRQGGDERGFTTEANLEVPEVDPNTVVDEPGYTPYYSSSSSTSSASSTPPAETPPQEDAVAEPPMAEAPVGEEEMAGIGDDPMAWLESLAKRQGGDARGFTTSADMEVPEIDPDSVVIDEPGYTPYGQSPAQPAAQQAPPPPAEEPVVAEPVAEEPPAPEPVPEPPMAEAPVAEDEMAGIGDDPMAWLESLAKRQGGDARGFTTSADMEVPEIDPDSVVIDEPGYTPYGQSPAQPAAQQAPPPPVEEPVMAEPVAEEPVIEEPPVPAESSQPILADGELPADIDPIKWLESLARRSPDVDARGLTNDEFYDIPEVDPDSVVIDEPGYTPSSSTATTGGAFQSASEPVMAEEPELVDFDELETAGAVDEDDWLTDLATESTGGDVDDFLAEMTDDSVFDLDEELDLGEEAPAASSVPDSIAGMTDDEIARAQAEGTITPEQELAWLQYKLTQVPDEEDFDIADLAPEDIEAAVETDVPDWLAAQMPSGDAEPSGDAIQDDMMALVGQSEELDLDDFDLGDDTFNLDLDAALEDDLELALDGDDELLEELEMPADLLAELEVDSPVAEGEFEIGDAGNLLEGFSPEADDWGFALEQDIEIEDISTVPEPDWYTEAMQKADSEMDEPFEDLAVPELSLEESPITPDVVDEEPSAAEGEALPDWLQDIEPTIEEDPSLPDWLRTDNEIEGWLLEQQTGTEDDTRDVPAPVFAESPIAESAAPAPASSGIGLPTDERLDKAREGGYPSWYVPPTTEQAPAPVVKEQAPPPPAPKPQPVAEKQAPPPPPKPEPKAEPTPAPAQPEPAAVMPAELADYVQRLERNPDDHSSRLTFARHLSRANQINESLDQYETLIKKAAELDNVSTELANLIKQLPAHPKARRLLGDVYMRQGRLQEALDTYRGALDKI